MRGLERGVWHDEARELASRLVGRLLALPDGQVPIGVLDAAFRDAHSLKGLLTVVGTEPAVSLAHALEELIAALRHGSLDASAEVVAALRAGAERCARLLDGEPADATGALREELLRLAARRDRAPPADPLERIAIDPALRESLTDYELDRLREAARRGLRLHRLAASAPGEEFDRALGSLRAELCRDGEVIAALPAAAPLGGGIGFQLVVASERGADALRRDLAGQLVEIGPLRGDELERVGAHREEAGQTLAAEPASCLFERLEPVVRSLAGRAGVDVRLECTGGEVRLDRRLADALPVPLIHLLRNAFAHGIEAPAVREASGKPPAARLSVAVRELGEEIELALSDDGAGLDEAAIARAAGRAPASREALLEWIFAPGFTTAPAVDERAGRGLGLDVVRRAVAGLGGRVAVESEPGRGTTFRLRLPARPTA